MSKKKTNEQFIYDIEQKHGKTITILDTYINNKIKVLCKCNICEYTYIIWYVNTYVNAFYCYNQIIILHIYI